MTVSEFLAQAQQLGSSVGVIGDYQVTVEATTEVNGATISVTKSFKNVAVDNAKRIVVLKG